MSLLILIAHITAVLIGTFHPAEAAEWNDYEVESLNSSGRPSGLTVSPGMLHSSPYAARNLLLSLLEIETFQFWMDNTWVNSSRRRHFYDSGTFQTETAHDSWHQTVWSQHTRDHYHWNDALSHIDSIVTLQTDGHTWSNTRKQNYNYDQSERRITFLDQRWAFNAWENYQQFSYSYDSQERIDSTLFTIWTNQQVENYELTTYVS